MLKIFLIGRKAMGMVNCRRDNLKSKQTDIVKAIVNHINSPFGEYNTSKKEIKKCNLMLVACF